MGAFAGVGRGWVVGVMMGNEGSTGQLQLARESGRLRKRSEAESSAYESSFPLNSAYRLSGMKA